jgi:hypothetical protein
LNRIFRGENAKNRDFSGVEKMKAAAVYRARINHDAKPAKVSVMFTPHAPSPGRVAALMRAAGDRIFDNHTFGLREDRHQKPDVRFGFLIPSINSGMCSISRSAPERYL